MTIRQKLTKKEAKVLIRDFEDYKEKACEIDFFPIHKTTFPDGTDEFTKWLYSLFSQYDVIETVK